MPSLGPWLKRDNRSTRSHQKLVDAINGNAQAGATGSLFTRGGASGTTIIDGTPNRYLDFLREGLLTDAGPNDEADPTDNTYWVKWAGVDSDDADVKASPSTVAPGDENAIALVTNRRESPAGSHLLPTDETCWVWCVLLIDPAGNRRWLMDVSPPVATFWATLGTGTQDGSNKRWAYPYTEAEKTGAGYGTWTAKVGGRTGTAYNSIEDMNGASGVYGNGVDSANLTGTFDIQPAPDGLLVRIELIPRADDPAQDSEAWFSYENGVDGACS